MNNRTASGAVSACGTAVIHPAAGGIYFSYTAIHHRRQRGILADEKKWRPANADRQKEHMYYW